MTSIHHHSGLELQVGDIIRWQVSEIANLPPLFGIVTNLEEIKATTIRLSFITFDGVLREEILCAFANWSNQNPWDSEKWKFEVVDP